MNLTERFFEITSDVRDQAAAYAQRTAKSARQTVDLAAQRVESAAGPIENLSAAAARFNAVAHTYANDLISHQANMLTGALHDGAERLRLLNKAQSLKDAYTAQVKYFDVTRDRLVRDAKTAWDIVGKTGSEMQTLAQETYAHWLRKPTGAKRASAQVRKSVRRARKAA